MIYRLESINEIIPIFREYLGFMSRFYNINDYDAWCNGALKNLQRYSKSDNGYGYVAKKSGTVIGFGLVNRHLRFNKDGFAVSEFYIQDGHRRKAYGRRLAGHLFNRLPGNWEVAVALKNSPAMQFWDEVISSYTDNQFLKKENESFGGYGFVFNT